MFKRSGTARTKPAGPLVVYIPLSGGVSLAYPPVSAVRGFGLRGVSRGPREGFRRLTAHVCSSMLGPISLQTLYVHTQAALLWQDTSVSVCAGSAYVGH